MHAQCHSRLGKASHVVTALVAELQPHLLVIRARGEHAGRGPDPCLGGTALKLLTRVDTPLLIVRGAGATPYSPALVAVDVAAHLQCGPMGGVGFRIAYRAPTDVLVLSS